MTRGAPKQAAPIEVRPSRIQGMGVFAVQRIPAGTRIIEYTGERISNEEADRRYDDDAAAQPHTFLFIVDDDVCIDGAAGGGDARLINHSCDPNCETVIEDGRVWVESICDIARGEELTYDYRLERPGRWRADFATRYACHCGAANCRGVLLVKPKRPKSANGRARK